MEINNLTCSPENYEEKIVSEFFKLHNFPCEMSDGERCFLNGLIRMYKPKNILEIGVSAGGGSALILNAIHDDPTATLTSIDLLNNYYKDSSLPVGWVVNKIYPSGNLQWSLHMGKDPVEVIEKLASPFDFCIIDTAHIHPIESINFLTVLPFLSDNAIVVLHDIALFMVPHYKTCMACKILFDSVVANKLLPTDKFRNNA